MKNLKKTVLYLAATAAAFSCVFLFVETRSSIKAMDTKMDSIEENFEEIYRMKAREEAKSYVTLDTMLRLFHYVKPHTETHVLCPECDDVLREGLEFPKRKSTEKTLRKQSEERINNL